MNKIINLKNIKKIFLVGICGSGMSGIAKVLAQQGFFVAGSDIAKNSFEIHMLEEFGIKVYSEHKGANVDGFELIVKSTAIPGNNPEVEFANKNNIKVIHRAVMLDLLSKDKLGVGVSGTHGKTTTTSLVTSIYLEANLNPSFIIGGKIHSNQKQANFGSGDTFIFEADESDKSFLHLSPKDVIVTNINNDHLENYSYDVNNLKKAFVQFINNIPADGKAVVCIDDEGVASILPQITANYISYGFDEKAEYKIANLQESVESTSFEILNSYISPIRIETTLLGKHNILNITAAVAVALANKIDLDSIVKAIKKFEGTTRRFNIYQNFKLSNKKIIAIDDYGHHPMEVSVTMDTIKKFWPNRRVIMIFQPHRFSRTKILNNEIAEVLSKADILFLLEVYASSEEQIVGYTSQDLLTKIKNNAYLIRNKVSLIHKIEEIIQNGDILLFQGAGDIGIIANEIINNIANKSNL